MEPVPNLQFKVSEIESTLIKRINLILYYSAMLKIPAFLIKVDNKKLN